MEMTATAFATAIAIAAFATWTWRALNWLWLKPKRLEACLRRQGISGTPYTFLVGDVVRGIKMLKEALSKPISLDDDFTKRVAPLLVETVKNHGKPSFMWTGPTPTLIVMKSEHIKQVLSKASDFPKPPANPIFKRLADGIAKYEGAKWAKHKRIVNPAFHLEKLKNMINSFYQSCHDTVIRLEQMLPEKGSTAEVDVWPLIVNLTGDAISRTAFGSNYEEGKRIFDLQEEQVVLVQQAVPLSFIPGWRFLPTRKNKRMIEIDREVKAVVGEIIKKRERAMAAGEAPKDDLLGVMLEANAKDKQGISLEDVTEECRLFYLGGQETTSSLLVWSMVMLSWKPEWQTRARDEVLQVLGHSNKPDFDALARLKTVTMILNESLRLYSPGVYLERITSKETTLGDMTLPKGILVDIPMLMVHHDTDLWGDDALEFKPERFEEGVSKATKNQTSFLPFGFGPRICLGINFAFMETKMALAMILQKFSFELSPSYAHAPRKILAVHPQFGAPLIFHRL